jgi:glycosyltransferase involved in cell wall biosynthesis
VDAQVVIGTFGEQKWAQLAEDRAIPSAPGAIHVHGDTLAEARNEGLARVTAPWVIFLDADDELSPNYVKEMSTGICDLLAPAVRYVRHRRPQDPYVPKVAGHSHDCTATCLEEGNWLVIGTAARTDLVREAGGFREWECYEDWDLWLRCYLLGATVEAIPSAVYTAHVRNDSRNRAPSIEVKNRVHYEIVKAIG